MASQLGWEMVYFNLLPQQVSVQVQGGRVTISAAPGYSVSARCWHFAELSPYVRRRCIRRKQRVYPSISSVAV